MENKEKNIELDSLKNTNPFKVPETYFDTLTDKIMNNVDIAVNTKKSTKIIRIIKPVLALTASFAIIFMLVYFPVKILEPQISKNKTSIEENEILNYIYLSDHVVFSAFNEEAPDTYNEELMETVLLASVSEMELLDLKN